MEKALSIILCIFLFFSPACRDTEKELINKAEKIHAAVLTLDTHCDTPMNFIRPGFDLGQRHEFTCVDFPKMKEGGLDAEFFVVFIEQGPRDNISFLKAHEKALSIFNSIRSNVEKNFSLAEIALTADDAYRIEKIGKIATFIGVENGYPIGKNLTRIKQYYDLGARYITLCHSKNNDICDSSTDMSGPEHNGLSPFGEELVREMNRVGIMVDVSHISDEAFYDVLKVTMVPVIASHSSCRALCENPRNMSDDMLIALKQNGGVIQICLLSNYLKSPEPNPELDSALNKIRMKYGDPGSMDKEKHNQMKGEFRAVRKKYEKLATVKDAVDHIDHVVQVIGIDYVGIGSDFDGGGGIHGCRNVSEMKNITIELVRRGYSRKDIEKIWGGNFMRVFRAADEFAGKNIVF